jgi:hypothetical protein
METRIVTTFSESNSARPSSSTGIDFYFSAPKQMKKLDHVVLNHISFNTKITSNMARGHMGGIWH